LDVDESERGSTSLVAVAPRRDAMPVEGGVYLDHRAPAGGNFHRRPVRTPPGPFQRYLTTSPSGRLRRDSSTRIEARTSISDVLALCSSSVLNTRLPLRVSHAASMRSTLSYQNTFDRCNRRELYDRTQPRSAKPANGGASTLRATFALPA
jgi:hypothetical protein